MSASERIAPDASSSATPPGSNATNVSFEGAISGMGIPSSARRSSADDARCPGSSSDNVPSCSAHTSGVNAAGYAVVSLVLATVSEKLVRVPCGFEPSSLVQSHLEQPSLLGGRRLSAHGHAGEVRRVAPAHEGAARSARPVVGPMCSVQEIRRSVTSSVSKAQARQRDVNLGAGESRRACGACRRRVGSVR